MNKAVVVIDMQNDFVDGSLGTKEAQKIVPEYEAKDYITPDFPDKPKGMHWKTYYKHRAKYYQYWRKGEDLWLSGIKL